MLLSSYFSYKYFWKMAGMFNMLLRSTVSVLIFTKSVTTLGHDQRCAGCDKTTIEGMCVANWKN